MTERLTLFPGQEAPFTIFVAGTPVPWGIIPKVDGTFDEIFETLRFGRRPKANIMLEPNSRSYQVRIARAAHLVIPRQLRGNLRLEFVLVCARPKRIRVEGRTWHGVAPDVDKVMRNILDGLQRGPTGKSRGKKRPKMPSGKPLPWPGAIADDCRVVCGGYEDWYGAEGEEPHTEIRIWEL